jgi:hypothetical protein
VFQQLLAVQHILRTKVDDETRAHPGSDYEEPNVFDPWFPVFVDSMIDSAARAWFYSTYTEDWKRETMHIAQKLRFLAKQFDALVEEDALVALERLEDDRARAIVKGLLDAYE